MAWDSNLDPQSPAYQIAADNSRYIRVLAGPGTGKSFALKRRVARLLEGGIAPALILPVTFTKVAAEDLQRELINMGVPGCEQIRGSTLHSLGMRVLSLQNVLAVTGRVARTVESLRDGTALPSSFGKKRAREKRIRAYEAARARLQHEQPGFAQAAVDAAFQHVLVAWLRFHEGMLIGEIIPELYRYLRNNPAAPERSLYNHVLVDEYQDLNKAEQGVVDLLSTNAALCVVGDDDQSLYSFKHAHPEGIRTSPRTHLGCTDHALLDCYRCPTGVVAIADADQINKHGRHPGEILVRAQRRTIDNPIHAALKDRGIPSKSYYQESELDSEMAQERLAIFKLFVNRADRIALRWLLGMGSGDLRAKSYARLRTHCEQTGQPLWDALVALADGKISIPYNSQLLQRFHAIQNELHFLEEQTSITDFVNRWLRAEFTGAGELKILVAALMDAAETPEELLSQIIEAVSQPEIPPDVTELRIMSLHKSKGLSSPIVVIAGCVDGL